MIWIIPVVVIFSFMLCILSDRYETLSLRDKTIECLRKCARINDDILHDVVDVAFKNTCPLHWRLSTIGDIKVYSHTNVVRLSSRTKKLVNEVECCYICLRDDICDDKEIIMCRNKFRSHAMCLDCASHAVLYQPRILSGCDVMYNTSTRTAFFEFKASCKLSCAVCNMQMDSVAMSL